MTKLTHDVRREVLVTEAPGRAPTTWVLTLSTEGVELRRKGSRERYGMSFERLLGVALRDAVNEALITKRSGRRGLA